MKQTFGVNQNGKIFFFFFFSFFGDLFWKFEKNTIWIIIIIFLTCSHSSINLPIYCIISLQLGQASPLSGFNPYRPPRHDNNIAILSNQIFF
jgi:uncharacterized membrane protein